jgi:hypothetical protein
VLGQVIDSALSVVAVPVAGNRRIAQLGDSRRRAVGAVDDVMAVRAQTAPCCAELRRQNRWKRDLLGE